MSVGEGSKGEGISLYVKFKTSRIAFFCNILVGVLVLVVTEGKQNQLLV